MKDWAKEERDRYWEQLCAATRHIGALEYLIKRFIEQSKDKHLVQMAKEALGEQS